MVVLFFQQRNYHHKTIAVGSDCICPLCNRHGGLEMSIYQDYVWSLGPILPGRKFGILTCQYCNTEIPVIKWTDALDKVYKEEKKKAKTPARLWRGLWVLPSIFLALLLLIKIATWNTVTARQLDGIEQEQLFANLKPGDVVMIDKSSSVNASALDVPVLTFGKIEQIRGDSVFIAGYPQMWNYKSYNEWTKIKPDKSAFDIMSAPVICSLKQLKQNRVLAKIDVAVKDPYSQQLYGTATGIVVY